MRSDSSSDSAQPRAPTAEASRAYWRRNLALQAALLLVWFGVSFGLGVLLVRPLNAFRLGGFPLGFWFAQQGAIYVFIVLIFVYARSMDRADARLRERSRGAE